MILENYKKGWKNIFNFKGRASRAEYWIFNILNWVLFVLLLIAISATFAKADRDEGMKSFMVFFIFICIPYLIAAISQAVRRIRDAGASGWWMLLFLPINAVLWGFPAIILGFIPSSAKSAQSYNRYQQKVPPDIKDFRYTPPTQEKPSHSKESTETRKNLLLKDFN